MDRQAVIDQLRSIIAGYLEGRGMELVDLIYRYEGGDLYLRILTDKPEGGISIGECAELNNQISVILDEKGVLSQRYILEVSSPGVGRPLKTKVDFLRCLDRRAHFFLSQAVNNKIEWEGTIIKADDNCVYVDIEGNPMEIPLDKINKAKQVI